MILQGLGLLAAWTRWVLPTGVFLGLALPDLARWAHPLLTPAVVLLLVVSMLRIDWSALWLVVRRPLVPALAIGGMLVALPLLVAILTAPLGLPEDLRRCLVLVSAMPPILSGPALASLAGLDAATALVVLVTATLVVPFSLPMMVAAAAEIPVAVGPLVLFARLGAVVGGSILAALVLRRIFGAARLNSLGPELNGMGVLLLLVFALGVMDGMTDLLSARPGAVLLYTGAAFGVNLGMQAVGMLAFQGAGPRRAVTLGFLAGNRNAALLLAVLPADPALLLFVAVAQFPIYLLPSLLFPVYRRLAGLAPVA